MKEKNALIQTWDVLEAQRTYWVVYYILSCGLVLSRVFDDLSIIKALLNLALEITSSFFAFIAIQNLCYSRYIFKITNFLKYAVVYFLFVKIPFALGFASVGGFIETLPTYETDWRVFFVFVSFYASAMHLLLMAVLGTALPAVLIRTKWGVFTSVSRFFRQIRYLFPRILLGLTFIALIAGFQFLFAETIVYRLAPRTVFGNVNPVGVAYVLSWQAIRIFGLALIVVVVYRAFLKDAKERGELPAAEADVFA
ncbi:hypothetical protein [Roseibium sp. MMSF_3544]|uniref:hypothetical protein n=1 Tax=unclassified Roseibium TaxID=2629323 RepID=UPI00273E6402|nr:hypothetical protein [Roseibium sp. MMSF_3544]